MNNPPPAAEDAKRYKVVVNDEEQYSIWPYELKSPLGWKALSINGTQKECLKYIADTWTDMRPLSIRKKDGPGIHS